MASTRNMPASRQSGLAIVEFAITLPLLLFMMLATAEVGRIFSQYNTLTQSVRDACRYAASNAAVGTTRIVSITPQLQTATSNLVVTGNVNGTGSALLPGLATTAISVTDAGNGYVSVAASYTYSPLMGSALPTFGLTGPISLTIPLNATVIMRAL